MQTYPTKEITVETIEDWEKLVDYLNRGLNQPLQMQEDTRILIFVHPEIAEEWKNETCVHFVGRGGARFNFERKEAQ